MPGDEWNGLARAAAPVRRAGKPLFVGEVGIGTPMSSVQLARAGVLASKLCPVPAGVVGVLAWNGATATTAGSSDSGYEIGPEDPALAVLGAY